MIVLSVIASLVVRYFFCKTDFDMVEIAKEEKAYAQYPLPKFYNFPSVEARERILYANFLKINQDVKDMIAEIQEFYKKCDALQ